MLLHKLLLGKKVGKCLSEAVMEAIHVTPYTSIPLYIASGMRLLHADAEQIRADNEENRTRSLAMAELN